ncbi:uncharacterized protein LOC115281709 [Suricata suricatta]|uniref:uncharacterized protein LOC115281709 n=1 Tax=Suricata suricatta TaxID=37032 RepID=UPI001155F4D7|nr:uncharacterized protein LOC115281709 [Suricata suricatta]
MRLAEARTARSPHLTDTAPDGFGVLHLPPPQRSLLTLTVRRRVDLTVRPAQGVGLTSLRKGGDRGLSLPAWCFQPLEGCEEVTVVAQALGPRHRLLLCSGPWGELRLLHVGGGIQSSFECGRKGDLEDMWLDTPFRGCGVEGLLDRVSLVAVLGNVPRLLRYLSARLHQRVRGRGGVLLCYDSDSVVSSGQVWWRGELSEQNRVVFDSCDGFFTNYNWREEHLERMLVHAGERRADVYAGVDVVGGQFDTHKSLELIRKHGFSAALFALGWVSECLEKRDFFQSQDESCWAAQELRGSGMAAWGLWQFRGRLQVLGSW